VGILVASFISAGAGWLVLSRNGQPITESTET
jgi:hypothetical protein